MKPDKFIKPGTPTAGLGKDTGGRPMPGAGTTGGHGNAGGGYRPQQTPQTPGTAGMNQGKNKQNLPKQPWGGDKNK